MTAADLTKLLETHRAEVRRLMWVKKSADAVPPVPGSIGATIRRLRIDKQLPGAVLAEKAGLSKGHAHSLETKNPKGFTIATLEKVANGLDMTLFDLMRAWEADINALNTKA